MQLKLSILIGWKLWINEWYKYSGPLKYYQSDVCWCVSKMLLSVFFSPIILDSDSCCIHVFVAFELILTTLYTVG